VCRALQLTELWADKEFAKTYSWIQNILRSIVPLLIMSTLNCFIVDALRRSARHVSAGVSSTGGYVHQRHVGRRVSPRNRRVTLMLVAVIIVFIVCVTPDAVMSTVFGFGYYDESSDLIRGIREITDFLLLVNSACNFLLYCAFNSVFRHRFRTLVVRQFYSCCCCCRRWLRCRLRPSGLTNCIATTNAMQPTVKGSPTLLPLNKSEMAAPADAIKNSPPLDSESESSEADVNGNSNGGNAIPMTSTRLRMRPPPPSGTDVTKSDLKTDDALLQLPRWCDTTSENCHGDGGGGIVVMPSALKHDNVVIAMDRPRDDDVSNETAIFSMRLRRESVDEHDESSDWL
jgi:hypothetical protein